MRRSQTAATTIGSLRDDCIASVCNLVLARASNRREILSASLFRRGWNSDYERELVLEDCKTNNNFEPHAFALRGGSGRFLSGKIDKECGAFPVVARGDDSFHYCGWLRQPPSMVSIAARADRGRSRRRRVRICCLETDIAGGENWIVGLPGRLVWLAGSQLCDLILPAGRSGITRCRFGIETNDAGKFVDHRGRQRRSDCFLLCATQRLAFPREERHLRRQSKRQ